jgi:drug/metabolite transporter (DMT)-like permease
MADGSARASASMRGRAAWTGAAVVAVSSVAFSAKAIMAKLMYREGVEPVAVLALRMGFALPVYVAGAWFFGRGVARLSRRELGVSIGLGAVLYYGSALADFVGLRYVSAGLERLIMFSYPTLVVLMAHRFLGERVRRVDLAALLATYAGIAVAFGAESQAERTALGALLVFASALAYAAYLVGSTRYIRRLGAERFTSIALASASVATLLHLAIARPKVLGHAPKVYALGLLMALLATVLPTYALAAGIRRIGPGPAATVGTIGPVSTLLLAHWLLGEPLSAQQILGTCLVLAGATLVARHAR